MLKRYTREGVIIPSGTVCKWKYDIDSDCWSTYCGNEFQLKTGTPAENEMIYCPYCGATIQEIK